MGNLANDTAIERAGDAYRARLSEAWNIWGPNGGYLAAVALRAAGTHSHLPRPASLLCHFLGVAEFDIVDLEATTLRAGKRAESVRVSMTQAGRPILEALVWILDDGLSGLRHEDAPAPAVPRPEELRSLEELLPPDAPRHGFFENFDERPTEWIDDWENRTAGSPEVRTWLRFKPRATFGDPFLDAARLAILVDTFQWPAATRAYDGGSLTHLAPSIDLSCSFHRDASAADWLLVEARAPIASDGLVGGTARVWDAGGRLLASGAQQMLCRPMPAQAS